MLRQRFGLLVHPYTEFRIAVGAGSILVALPVFVLQIAFANATVEETGVAASLRNAWRRLSVARWVLPIAALIASGIIVALVDEAAWWLANATYPPFLPGTPPSSHAYGLFASGVPLEARVLLKLVDVPLNAFLAMVTLATALAIADFAAERDSATNP
jgi:hypothetical protein